MNRLETLRDARLRLNQIEYWLRHAPDRFSPTHLVVLRSAIEEAATPYHVRILEGYLREWMLPETAADRAPEPRQQASASTRYSNETTG